MQIVTAGYLAVADTLHIREYPALNTGAIVQSVTQSIVADAPRVAIGLSKLGASSAFVGNNVGDDQPGYALLEALTESGVQTATEVVSGTSSPRIIVLSDEAGNREWFAHIPQAIEDLRHCDLSPLEDADLVYLDGYEILDAFTDRVFEMLDSSEGDVYLNLGEREVSGPSLTTFVRSAIRPRIVQASVPDESIASANSALESILDLLDPEIALVTMGSNGCLTSYRGEMFHTSSIDLRSVRDCNNAGAAFAVGVCRGLLLGERIEDAVSLGSLFGAMSCATGGSLSIFSQGAVDEFREDHGKETESKRSAAGSE